MVRSATLAAMGPVMHMVLPMYPVRWWDVLRPYKPLKLAGMRILPPASVATEKGTTPAQTAEAGPEEDPPG